MILTLFILFFVRAEETKSIPTVEIYNPGNAKSCARECMKISASLNEKNNTPQVMELFEHNCAEKIEKSKTENPVIYSEILRCANMGKDKLAEIKNYIFNWQTVDTLKETVRKAPSAISESVVYSIQNADKILSNAYTSSKTAVSNATTATLEALKGLNGALSKSDYESVLKKCDAEVQCRIAVARGFLQFQERKPNGDYIFSDQDVLNKIKGMDFRAILHKSVSESNIAKQECQRLQDEIMKLIYFKNNNQWPTDLEQQLNKELVAKNPACPFVLTKESPARAAMYGDKKPDPPSTTHMWSMVDSCFGRETLQEINDLACSIAGKEAATAAIGGAIAKSIQLGVKGLQAKKAADLLHSRKMIPAGHEVLSVIDGKVITRTTENGKPVYYTITNGKAPEKLSMDPSGFAINARDGANRQLALADITAAQTNGQGKATLFIDVNNLGKVNYFKAGSQAGDEYLGEVARIISEKTGGNGKVYRWGGDEFVVVLNETDKAKLRELNQSISDAVMSSPKLRAIFSAEKKAAAERYKTLFTPHGKPNPITSYDELPAAYKDTLTPAEAAFAKRDFPAFRARVQEVDLNAIRDSAAIQPSISMGAALANGRKADDVLAAADAQAARVKKDYKSALGCDDTKKYTGREAYLIADGVCMPRNLSAKPVALEPD